MDFRRYGRYQLARISEEDEDEIEEEANEETSMIEDEDEFAFEHEASDQDTRKTNTSMSSPSSSTSSEIRTSPTFRQNENGSEVIPVHEQESSPAHTQNDDESQQRHNGIDSIPDTPPPSYQDPPSYHEVIRYPSAKVEDKSERKESDSLEWDRDEAVEPNMTVNPFDVVLGDTEGDIEMGEIHDPGHEFPDSQPVDAAETSYITPAPEPLSNFVEPMEIESQVENRSSGAANFGVSFKQMSSRRLLIILFSVLVAIAAMLIVILLPLTFSYVEYYELGLKKQRSTGRVLFNDGTYESGRYATGPDYTFKKYPSMATNIQMDGVAVTTTAGLSHSFSCSFQYFIREGELGLLEQRFDQGYPEIIKSVAKATLKNTAATVSLSMYFYQRRQVEIMFHDALRAKLGGNCCPDRERCLREGTCHLCSNSTTACNKGYHVDVPFFQLLGIDLPDVINNNNLQVQLMNERAETEKLLQKELLTRKETERLRQDILNAASEITINATSQAKLILSIAEAKARATVEDANNRGLALMYNMMGVTTEEHKASLHWLRALEKHDMLVMGISFNEYLKIIGNCCVTKT